MVDGRVGSVKALSPNRSSSISPWASCSSLAFRLDSFDKGALDNDFVGADGGLVEAGGLEVPFVVGWADCDEFGGAMDFWVSGIDSESSS